MLQIRHLTLIHRGDLRTILDDFSLTVQRGDRVVIIGEEGNGKSTLLRWIFDPALVEDYIDARGTRTTSGEKLVYLPQELPAADRGLPVWDWLNQQDFFANADPGEIARTSSRLRVPQDLFYSDQPMGTLSGGERIKVQMAALLAQQPDILLLDEPSNDIDIEMLLWLEEQIRSFAGAVLFISHDETLIERTANRVVLLEQLRRKTLPRATVANVPFLTFRREREEAFEKQARLAGSERREEKKAMERFRRIEQTVEHQQATVSRQDPHGGFLLKRRMAKVKALERRYEREHEEMTDYPEQESAITIRFDLQAPMPAGKTVLDLRLPELKAPDGRLLARDIALKVRGPQKIALIGRNGAGKTTLLRLIADRLLADPTVRACYMPQNYEDLLIADLTPIDFLAPSGSKEDVTRVRTYLGSMKYTADEMLHPISELSGGQKAKILLLSMSLTAADVLILDEPTRNFSPLSGPEIRRIIKDFPGAVISVSHDRRFLREVCDQVYELTKDGLSPRSSAG